MRPLLTVSLWLILLPTAGAPQHSPAHATFPSVTSYNLEKSRMTLPSDLAGRLNILLLLFRHDQQAEVDSWSSALAGILAAHPEVKAYTLPVFQSVNVLSRWYMNSSLRSSSLDPRQRATTVPLYVDKTTFLHSLHISSENQVVLLIADRQGKVFWQTYGPGTQENGAALNAAVATALKHL